MDKTKAIQFLKDARADIDLTIKHWEGDASIFQVSMGLTFARDYFLRHVQDYVNELCDEKRKEFEEEDRKENEKWESR